MKTLTTKFTVLILILALAIGSHVKAQKDSVCTDKKETVNIKIHAPVIKFISEAFELNETDFIVLNNKFDQVPGISVTYGEQEFEFVINIDAFKDLNVFEDYEEEQLEDWMFTELITEEEAQPLEDWMFEELIPEEEEEAVLEDWMFDTD